MYFSQKRPPGEVIYDNTADEHKSDSDWFLALFDAKFKIKSVISMSTHIKHKEDGMWSMVYSELKNNKSHVVVKIEYDHTGSGGGREQRFECNIDIDINTTPS